MKCDRCRRDFGPSDLIGQEWLAARKSVLNKNIGNTRIDEITYQPVQPAHVISVSICRGCFLRLVKKRVALTAGGLFIFLTLATLFFLIIFTDSRTTTGTMIAFVAGLVLCSAALLNTLVTATRELRKQSPEAEDILDYKQRVLAPFCRSKLKQTRYEYAFAQGEGEDVRT